MSFRCNECGQLVIQDAWDKLIIMKKIFSSLTEEQQENMIKILQEVYECMMRENH